MFIGSVLSGIVKDKFTTGIGADAVTNWTSVWLVPAGIAAVVLILFFLFFRDRDKTVDVRA